jgi:hypothetical protein
MQIGEFMFAIRGAGVRLLACGSRAWTHAGFVQDVVEGLAPDAVVIHGLAGGADRMAGAAAERRGLEVVAFPAQWDLYGRRAGYLRNQQMLEFGRPTHCVAFVHPSLAESRGTANMVSLARAAGVPTAVFYSVDLGCQAVEMDERVPF